MDEQADLKKRLEEVRKKLAAEGEISDDAAEKVSGGWLRKLDGFDITKRPCPYCGKAHDVYQFAGIGKEQPQMYICQEQAYTFYVKPSGEIILDDEWLNM